MAVKQKLRGEPVAVLVAVVFYLPAFPRLLGRLTCETVASCTGRLLFSRRQQGSISAVKSAGTLGRKSVKLREIASRPKVAVTRDSVITKDVCSKPKKFCVSAF